VHKVSLAQLQHPLNYLQVYYKLLDALCSNELHKLKEYPYIMLGKIQYLVVSIQCIEEYRIETWIEN